MFIPNGFTPSTVNHATMYDEEGRLKSFRINSRNDDDAGIAEANSLYATNAEMFGTITPFLRVNRIADAQRRNYVVQPGGACIYWQEDPRLEDPYLHGRVQFTGPSERESFGHDSQPGGPKSGSDQRGRAFTVGEAGRFSQGPGR